ncbi:hypothetical protein J4217_03230 [Candidatus Pacearchaeota archaeon]|nr:hypothetical protein [Candidatus Pacearchaeota archaeon]
MILKRLICVDERKNEVGTSRKVNAEQLSDPICLTLFEHEGDVDGLRFQDKIAGAKPHQTATHYSRSNTALFGSDGGLIYAIQYYREEPGRRGY